MTTPTPEAALAEALKSHQGDFTDEPESFDGYDLVAANLLRYLDGWGWRLTNEPSVKRLNPLLMAFAIDDHRERWPAHEPMHDGGTCSSDCAADIAKRYDRAALSDTGAEK